ncbi:MAG TPA: hypothetical protein PL070_04800, partial [Flavobacteriales bacterium]|nr:hypothetical protein [Flavobacteriales bacterium]
AILEMFFSASTQVDPIGADQLQPERSAHPSRSGTLAKAEPGENDTAIHRKKRPLRRNIHLESCVISHRLSQWK